MRPRASNHSNADASATFTLQQFQQSLLKESVEVSEAIQQVHRQAHGRLLQLEAFWEVSLTAVSKAVRASPEPAASLLEEALADGSSLRVATLWSWVEMTLNDLARACGSKHRRNRSNIDAIHDVLQQVGINARPNVGQRRELRKLTAIRNLVFHCGGRIDKVFVEFTEQEHLAENWYLHLDSNTYGHFQQVAIKHVWVALAKAAAAAARA